MEISNDLKSNDDILDNHKEKLAEAGVKKYVISIYNEFVPLMDSMSVEERTEAINEIISVHNDAINEKKLIKRGAKVLVAALIGMIVLIFAAPCLLWLVNKSYTLTRNSYNEMQTNFEVLYRK